MGILRSTGKGLGVLILSISLASAILITALVKFTEYDSLKSFVTEMFAAQFTSIDEKQMNDTYSTLLAECQQADSVELTVAEGRSITLNCKDVRASNPQDLPKLLGASIFNDIYYRKYDCEFIECLQRPGEERLTIFFSYKANLFFKSIQNFLWIGTTAGLVLILVSVEKWEGRLKTLGITLLVLGIPTLILGYFKDYFLPAEAATMASPIITQFFGSVVNGFFIVTIVGLILTGVGYSLKFFKKKRKK